MMSPAVLFLLFAQQLVEIRNCFLEAIAQLHLWLPSEQGLGKTDVRAALLRVILWQRVENDFRRRTRELDDLFGELPDRELDGIAEVDGAAHRVRGLPQTKKPLDQVIDVAERAGLLSFAVDRDVLVAQRLDDKVRHHPAIGS